MGRWWFGLVVAGFVTGMSATEAHAVEVLVKPGNYEGSWRIDDVTARVLGEERVEVPPGAHTLVIGETYTLPFEVDEDGVVVTRAAGATGGDQALSLETVPVILDHGSYRGEISLGWGWAGRWFKGRSTVHLVPGGPYHLDIGNFNGLGFEVAADGTLRVDEGDTAKATVAGSILSLNTASAYLDIGSFAGCSTWDRGPECTPGGRYVELVPGGAYRFTAGGWNRFMVHVDDEGELSIAEDDAAKAEIDGRTVQMLTVPVVLDPGRFEGPFSFDYGARWWTGPQTLELVPGGYYGINAGGWTSLFIHVDDEGMVTLQSPFPDRDDSPKARAEGDTVTFRTVPVTLEVGDYPGLLGLASGPQWSGTRTVQLVPGGEYMLDVSSANKVFFRVGPDGEVTVDAGEAHKAVGEGGTLLLQTQTVRVAPASPSLQWRFDRLETGTVWHHGEKEIPLVPGPYRVRTVSQSEMVQIASPTCAVDPTRVTLEGVEIDLDCAQRAGAVSAEERGEDQPRQAGAGP